ATQVAESLSRMLSLVYDDKDGKFRAPFVAADPVRNGIIIRGTGDQMEEVKEALKAYGSGSGRGGVGKGTGAASFGGSGFAGFTAGGRPNFLGRATRGGGGLPGPPRGPGAGAGGVRGLGRGGGGGSVGGGASGR